MLFEKKHIDIWNWGRQSIGVIFIWCDKVKIIPIKKKRSENSFRVDNRLEDEPNFNDTKVWHTTSTSMQLSEAKKWVLTFILKWDINIIGQYGINQMTFCYLTAVPGQFGHAWGLTDLAPNTAVVWDYARHWYGWRGECSLKKIQVSLLHNGWNISVLKTSHREQAAG